MNLLHSVSTFEYTDGGVPPAIAGLINHICHYPNYNVSLLYGSDGAHEQYPVDERIGVITTPFVARNGLGRLRRTGFGTALKQTHSKRPIDLLHYHGVWLRTVHELSHIAYRVNVPVVVSPHGMFNRWPMSHNRLKKKLAWLLYQKTDCNRALAFHVTSPIEAQSVRKLGIGQPIAMIPNGVPEIPAEPLDPEASSKPKKERIALYFSRISHVKNIPTMLKAWAKIRPSGWKLVIVGNDDEGLLPTLKQLTVELNLSEGVSFEGPKYRVEKDTIFRRADLFLLPTFTENFGIVVAEALQYSLPVITTTGAPWEGLKTRGCGWWVEPTVDAFAGALAEALALPSEELQRRGSIGAEWVRESFLWKPLAQQLWQFYEWLFGRESKPDCVITD